MTEPAFITGGSGFIGRAVLEGLVAQGREVRALARSDAAADRVRSLGAIPVRGDVRDGAALAAGIDGCSTVFHVAGINAICIRNPAAMFETNVGGTLHVLRAAASAGAARVILTSSAATIGERRGLVGREDTAHRGWFLSDYERSKTIAERRGLVLAEELGLDLVCVNPSSVQGPGRTTGTATLLLRLARANRTALLETVLSVVDIRDCAQGHLLAEARGEPGQRYLLNGASLPAARAVELLREHAGGPRRVVWIPRPLVRAAVPLVGVANRIRPGLPVCPAMLKTLLHGHRYDGSRAERELGLEYTPIEETVRRAVDWYRARGLLPNEADRVG